MEEIHLIAKGYFEPDHIENFISKVQSLFVDEPPIDCILQVSTDQGYELEAGFFTNTKIVDVTLSNGKVYSYAYPISKIQEVALSDAGSKWILTIVGEKKFDYNVVKPTANTALSEYERSLKTHLSARRHERTEVQTIQPNHVAVLVPSVRKAADYLTQFDFQIANEEVWDGEGTREIYIERDKGNSLLLMEPIKPGAYQRALEKRGPGLHHLAIDVLNLETYILSLAGSGWLLHPMSVKTMKQSQTAYLARPGFPALIEVQERKELKNCQLFVEEVLTPLDAALVGLVKHIGLEGVVKNSSGPTRLSVGGQAISLEALL